MIMTSGGLPQQPQYIAINEMQGKKGHRPPPPPAHRRNIPRYHAGPSAGTKFLRCICCCYCCLILFVILFFVVSLCIFLYFKPQTPSYTVDNFTVHTFDVKPDSSLFTQFALSVKTLNPNERIGFRYEKGGNVKVEYSGFNICSGEIPSFYQGGRKTSNIDVELKGKSQFGSGMQASLMEDRHNGRIPLLVKVKAHIRLVALVLGDIHLRDFVVHLNCSLVIDNLTPNKPIKILSSNYTYGFGG